jgi:hypothetical protein
MLFLNEVVGKYISKLYTSLGKSVGINEKVTKQESWQTENLSILFPGGIL